MRRNNHKWNIWGRRITVLLLLCGLLLPIVPQSYAASVTYEYNWIKDTTGLPTDDQWHDYFIAWEDLKDSNKVWFADYHWYTADGESNIDAGGSDWMEYKAASTLPDSKADRFTSEKSLGHMQIKYAGKDGDHANSPKYYIRVSKMNGGYSYFTAYEPTNNEKDAEAFTFEDHGDVFHIFVNMSGSDRYLTRDGQDLETSYTISVSGGKKYRPLRVYQRNFIIDENCDDAAGDEIMGKVDLYEYYWINEPQELLDLAENSKDWVDVVIAWNDTETDAIWYTKEMWVDNGSPNYRNDFKSGRYAYWSNDTLGSGYTTATSDSFVVPDPISHFQVKHVGWDSDNEIKGIKDKYGFDVDSPVFNIRFSVGPNLYMYLGEKDLYTDSEEADTYTIQMFADETNRDNNFGYVHIFSNWSWAEDEYLARYGNRFALQEHNNTDDWQYYFRIYAYRMVQYDAIVKSFTVGKGTTYSIDSKLVLNEGVTITVEDGGVLMVDRELLNNGNIVVKNGGTVIVNQGGCIMPFSDKSNGKITLNGGNLIIMDNAQLLCDTGDSALLASNGSTIVNRGMLMVGKVLELRNNSYLKNSGLLVVGGKLTRERGKQAALSVEQLEGRVTNGAFAFLCSAKSILYNYGTVSVPKNAAAEWDANSFTDMGQLLKR